MNSLRNLFVALAAFMALVWLPLSSKAQCPNDNSFDQAVSSIPCGTPSTVTVGAGRYVTFPVVANATYVFSTCNSTGVTGSSFDTELTGYNASGGTFLFFNDDQGGTCTNCTTGSCGVGLSNESYVQWTSTFTGTIRIMMDKYNCDACAGGASGTNCPALGSAALHYNQVSNVNLSVSNATVCSGTSVTLTGSPAGGSYSGTGVSGNTFIAPATAGNYTVTYTLGACSSSQIITVNSLSTAPTSVTSTAAVLCQGSGSSTVTLTENGGVLGSGATYKWYSGGCGTGSGGTLVGSGPSVVVTPPVGATTYYVRAEGTCNNTTCASTTVTVKTPSTDPTSITTDNDNFCPGGTAHLTVNGGSLGTNATWHWYSGSSCCGTSAGTGSTLTVSPTTTTTYYARAEGDCNNTNYVSITINVKTTSTVPTSVLSSNGTIFCSGTASTTLSFTGGSLGTNAVWKWYRGSCGGTLVGSGPSIGVNPTTTTTYFVRAEGDCGNSACASITINISTGLAITGFTNTNVTCFGGNNGSSTVNVTGGIPSYTYAWSNSGSTATINGLTSGPYSVTVTDNAGCTTTSSTSISQPTAITIASVSVTPVACNGDNSGAITVTASGGTGALQYSNDGGANYQASGVFPSLYAGFYGVTVKDSNNCTVNYASNPVVVTQPTALTIAITSETDAACNGVNNGSVTGAASGGSTPYQYSINGSPLQPGATFSNLSAGTYTILVQDAHGCTATHDTTVNNSTGVLLQLDSTLDITCNGLHNGAIYASALLGTSPYSYTVNGITYQPTGSFTGLNGGSYSVLVKDAAGCTASLNTTINEPSALVATIDSVHNVNCGGTATGDIYLSVTGGTGAYTYSWTGGATSQNLTGVAAGHYVVTVTDANGCSTTASANITEPQPLLVSLARPATVNCNGGSDGIIDINVYGGSPPYTYNWSNGDTSQDASSLTAGTYDVTVTDNNGCIVTGSYNVTQPAAALSLSAVVTDVTCSGSATGAIDLTVSGGTGPYTYSWSNGATSQDLTGIPAGTYNVLVTDAHGCSANAGYTVTGAAALQVSLDTIYNVACNGGANGAIYVTVTGGTGAYTYAWSDGVTTTEDLVGVAAGTYTLSVSDAGGCSTTFSATVSQPTAIQVASTTFDVSCNGGSDGVIAISVTGGTNPYTYTWSGGLSGTTNTGLSAGNYDLTVTDAAGCNVSGSFFINQPTAIQVLANVTDVSCAGGSTGAVYLTVSGGSPSYTYNWSNGAHSQNIVNVPAGTYDVTVTDAHSCTVTGSYTVGGNLPLTLTFTPTSVHCFGGNDGQLATQVSGGAGSYTYLWSNGQTSANLTNLSAGTYTVVVTDAAGCSITGSATVGQPTPLTLANAITNVTCNAGTTGVITVTAGGGVSLYNFAWSNGHVDNGTASSTITGLAAGVYTVTLTDANNCSLVSSYTVTEPSAIQLSAQVTDLTCFGSSNGAVTLSVSGGVGPYNFLWTGGATTQNISGLAAGSYTVNVTDDNGCTSSLTAVVHQPDSLSVQGSVVNVTCAGNNNGAIFLTANGGTPSYSYLWSNGATTQDLTSLSGGTYTVTVTDHNGCTKVSSFTVNEPAAIVLSINGTNATCYGQADGAATLTVTGGTAPYSFLWSNFQTTQDLTNLAAGTYTVVVTDNNGCRAVDSITITQYPDLVITDSIGNVACNGGNEGSITLTVTGGVPPYRYDWSNGATTAYNGMLTAGTYTVTVTDSTGCSKTMSYTVIQPNTLVLTGAVTDATCYGTPTGAIDITVTGGASGYLYSWSGGIATEDRNNLAAGVYNVTVFDAHGCTITDSFTVNQPDSIDITITADSAACAGQSNGGALLSATGGVAPYTYFWSNFTFDQNLTNVPSGHYVVIVTDNNGCQKNANITIGEPDPLTLSIVPKSAGCGTEAHGEADAIVTGGTQPYHFQWSNGDTTTNIYNLAAGTYTVTLTDAHGCTAIATAEVSSLPKPVASFTYNIACAGLPTEFINTSTISAGTVTYTWDFGNGDTSNIESPAYNYPQPGTFLVELTAVSDQGCADQVSQVVIVSALPDATITANGDTSASLCGADSLSLSVPDAAASIYEWSTGETTSSITVNYSGIYTVTVTNAQGCASTDTVNANIFNGDDITITPDTTISLGYSIQLQATGGTTYIWSPADGLSDTTVANPIATPLATTTYVVVIHPGEGCTATRQVTVTVAEDFLVDAPNVFSPNGDGVHDFWTINNITTYPICKVTVYNRWGSEVFTAENYQNTWDGTKDGKALPDGTYYYIIKCNDKVYKGAVTILR